MELLLERLCVRKASMEAKGLKVNVGKTKVMHCQAKNKKNSVIQNPGKGPKCPCGMCGKGVRDSAIQYV